jgi:hypothetical protein
MEGMQDGTAEPADVRCGGRERKTLFVMLSWTARWSSTEDGQGWASLGSGWKG